MKFRDSIDIQCGSYSIENSYWKNFMIQIQLRQWARHYPIQAFITLGRICKLKEDSRCSERTYSRRGTLTPEKQSELCRMNWHRGDLSDEQWQKLRPLLPLKAPTGRPANDHRQMINGILWIQRTGAPWDDLPERYGSRGTVSSRFYRWRKQGGWQQILERLQQQADAVEQIDWEVHFIDSTVVRAHQHAAGAKRGG